MALLALWVSEIVESSCLRRVYKPRSLAGMTEWYLKCVVLLRTTQLGRSSCIRKSPPSSGWKAPFTSLVNQPFSSPSQEYDLPSTEGLERQGSRRVSGDSRDWK